MENRPTVLNLCERLGFAGVKIHFVSQGINGKFQRLRLGAARVGERVVPQGRGLSPSFIDRSRPDNSTSRLATFGRRHMQPSETASRRQAQETALDAQRTRQLRAIQAWDLFLAGRCIAPNHGQHVGLLESCGGFFSDFARFPGQRDARL